jgi:hypothetical protein
VERGEEKRKVSFERRGELESNFFEVSLKKWLATSGSFGGRSSTTFLGYILKIWISLST